MARFLRAISLVSLPLLLAAADNRLTPAEKTQGWKLLFDGTTYANWEDPTQKSPPGDSFTIEDGCLKSVPHPKIEEDLFTAAAYSDFELLFDWRISPRGNSGVKYRIQDRVFLPEKMVPHFEDNVTAALAHRPAGRPAKGQEYVIGFEYQITDNAANPDALHNGALHQTAALYDMFPPLSDATLPVGEFNHSRIVARGDHIEHWLNGKKVVAASLKAPEVARSAEKRWGKDSPVYRLLVNQPKRSCQISLQNHGDACWFKNIKIRELK